MNDRMFDAGSPPIDLAELLRTIDVRTLVLHHLVPGAIDRGGWTRVAARLDRVSRTDVISGEDGMALCAR